MFRLKCYDKANQMGGYPRGPPKPQGGNEYFNMSNTLAYVMFMLVYFVNK